MTSVTHVSERLLPMSPVCTVLRALGCVENNCPEPRSGDRIYIQRYFSSNSNP
jgi:hypothetical protein